MPIRDVARIALFTDFGAGPYVGQMHARLSAAAPRIERIDLAQDLPAFRPDLAGYLLPALMRDMPPGTLYLCVVDPGVGGPRDALLVDADQDCLIGPDNGLFAPLLRHRPGARAWRIGWRPEVMSASFHGRDWFALAAARLCKGQDLQLEAVEATGVVGADWPPDVAVVVYVDRYGNLITGLRAPPRSQSSVLVVGPRRLKRARTFCEVEPGQLFWYENAFGLVEIAVSQGRADAVLGLSAGDAVGTLTPGVA